MNKNILTSTDKLSAFQKKNIILKNACNSKKTIDIYVFVQNNNIHEINPIKTQHLELLKKKIRNTFPH